MALIKTVRKWRTILLGNHFTLRTDQQAVSYIFNKRNGGRTKNDKILRWKIELYLYDYEILHIPGINNKAADPLTRCNAITKQEDMHLLHTRPLPSRSHETVPLYQKQKFALFDGRSTKSLRKLQNMAELKPKFYHSTLTKLIKATRPFERISLDLKGPLPTTTGNKYLLMIIDEYFPFPIRICMHEYFL